MKRYSKAYNKFPEGYDPSKPDMNISCLDANNLYRWAMSQPLPKGGFEWINVNDINADKGYIPYSTH